MKRNLFYIDYLDVLVSGQSLDFVQQIWLRYDLLLFSNSTLIISVPACVERYNTSSVLMQLNDFWKNGRIMLTMDEKYEHNPAKYFAARKSMLEKSLAEEKLQNHFEYAAYSSEYSKGFYNDFIGPMFSDKSNLYIDRIKNADECFRQSVFTQIDNHADTITAHMSTLNNITLNGVFNNLLYHAQDKKELFQRTLVIEKVKLETNMGTFETKALESILDRGFVFANAVVCGSTPLSLITNQYTGKTLSKVIQMLDEQLYNSINSLPWNLIFELSNSRTWKAFVYNINEVLYAIQATKRYNEKVLPIRSFEFALPIIKLIQFTANYVIGVLKNELKQIPLADPISTYENILKTYVTNTTIGRNRLINALRTIEELLPVFKKEIEIMKMPLSTISRLQREKGYVFNL